MGRHRNITTIPKGGPPKKKGPVNPKKGKEKNSCRQVAEIDFLKEWLEHEEKYWREQHGVEWNDVFGVGGRIFVESSEDYYGEEQRAEGDPLRQPSNPSTVGELANPPKDEGFDPNNPRTYVPRDEYEVDKRKQGYKSSPDDPKPTDKVHARNKKKKALEKKKNDRIPKPEGEGPHTVPYDEAVQNIVEEAGFEDSNIDKVEGYLPVPIDFNEMFVSECIDMICKMAGANWTVGADGVFQFFTPDSRPHPVIATTDPFGVKDYLDMPINPIQANTLELTESSDEITNRVQVTNSGEKSREYPEDFYIPPETPTHEFHLSYEPEGPVTAYISTGGEIPIITPIDVEQDWGDRTYLPETILGRTGYYPSPPYSSPPTGADIVAKLNKDEKVIRLYDKSSGEPYYLAGMILNITYFHLDPVYMSVEDAVSIAEHGIRDRLFICPDKHRIEEVQALAEAEVRDYSEVVQHIECKVYNDVYAVGDSVRFIVPAMNIDARFCVYEVEREFDADNPNVGQAVKIKAGSKVPIKLAEIINALNRRISALERPYNLTDPDSETKFEVPIRNHQYLREQVGIKDELYVDVEIVSLDRIDTDRIDSGKIT